MYYEIEIISPHRFYIYSFRKLLVTFYFSVKAYYVVVPNKKVSAISQ